MQNISLFQLLILEIHSILESCNQIDQTHFWPFPQKIIDQNLIVFESAISVICSGDSVHLKILQSDLLPAFWPISQEKYFYLYMIMNKI